MKDAAKFGISGSKNGTVPGQDLNINKINCAKITLPLFIIMKVYYINQLT